MKNIGKSQVLLLWEAVAGLHRAMAGKQQAYLKSHALSQPQIEVLYSLSNLGDQNIKDIAGTMNISSSAATQIVEGLVKFGYVARVPDPKDRRAVALSLTAKGTKKFNDFKQQHLKFMEYLLKGLDEKEIEMLIGVPAKIIKQLNKLDGELK